MIKKVREESEGKIFDSGIEGRQEPVNTVRAAPHTKLSKKADR